jgi:hypothetical protein
VFKEAKLSRTNAKYKQKNLAVYICLRRRGRRERIDVIVFFSMKLVIDR